MPTRTNKRVKTPTPQRTSKSTSKKQTGAGTTANAGTPPPAPNESDPPIIIQGGGSVTIKSAYPFDLTNKPGDAYPFVYYSKDASITWMEMKGKGNPQKDHSNNGNFEVKLYRK
jgi:hypothetical protein